MAEGDEDQNSSVLSRIPPLSDEEIEAARLDPRAAKEAAAIGSDKYEAKERERQDQFSGAFHEIAVWGLRILSVTAGLLVLSYVWHLLGPVQWKWIEAPYLEKIESLLVGVGAAFAGRVFQRYQLPRNGKP